MKNLFKLKVTTKKDYKTKKESWGRSDFTYG